MLARQGGAGGPSKCLLWERKYAETVQEFAKALFTKRELFDIIMYWNIASERRKPYAAL
jgi:hypothetical protein